MESRCVQCGFGIKTLYVQSSPGNIRLLKCGNCKAVADEYIECEIMIVAIDLILQKPKAYRHLLYNVLRPEIVNFEKLSVGFLLLDAYRSLLLRRSSDEWGLSISFSSLVWTCQRVLMDVIVGNLMFHLVFFVATRTLLTTFVIVSRCNLLALIVSSYFKVFLLSMMVWEFPSSVVYIIDLYVLSSNSMALKVMTESAMNRCIAACFAVHAVKICISRAAYI